MFNTLKLAKKLEEVGFSRDQAETSVQAWVEMMEDRLATKEDVTDLRHEIDLVRKEDIASLRHEIDLIRKEDIASLRHEISLEITSLRHEIGLIRRDMDLLKKDLTIKLGAMQAASIFVVGALIKFL